MEQYQLNNQNYIPCIGFGTYKIDKKSELEYALTHALEFGYRHIDTASIYNNEEYIGEVIQNIGIDRKELFITSKVWNDMQGYDSTILSCHNSLEKLKTDYLDLFLIHWPAPFKFRNKWKDIMIETWSAMEYLLSQNLVKSIGISNFKIHHIEHLLSFAKTKPVVNQIELHPGFQQTEIVKYCKSQNILIEAWGPLGQGRLLDNNTINTIANEYNKTISQIILKWSIQKGFVPLVKSINKKRIQDNINIFDFTLSTEHMQQLDTIPTCAWSRLDSDRIFF